RIRGHRLDVPALPLGVDGVEGKRRLARARQAGDDDELIPRKIDVDVLPVVYTGAADRDALVEIHASLAGRHVQAPKQSSYQGTPGESQQPERQGFRTVQLNRPSSSANGTAPSKLVNVPSAVISRAARRTAAHAVRASAPPTLMRRTPASASSLTVANGRPTRTFTGTGATACTTARTCSRLDNPGA